MNPVPGLAGQVDDPRTISWTEDDVARYVRAVGGADGQVPPAFAITVAQSGGPQLGLPGVDLTRVLHAEQSLVLHGPLPRCGTVRVTRTVTDVFDKVSGALVVSTYDAVDPGSRAPLFRTRSSVFVRGAGGFGGERGTTSRPPLPGRAPDAVLRYRTTTDQALLYRETGDRNPMHWDPGFAARAGFDRPILHGLATFGITARLLADRFGTDPSTVEGRFTGPVFPGDELEVSAWRQADEVVFRTSVDDVLVIDGGKAGPPWRLGARTSG